MKKSFLYFLFALLFFSFQGKAQIDTAEFLRNFARADARAKVKMVATRRFEEIKGIYPLLKDTLDKIRRQVFMTPQPNMTKVFFDEIDAEIALQEKNYLKAIIILENCLRKNAANINDSLKCWVELKKLFMKIRNYNKALEIQHLLELKWNRKSDTVLMGYGTSKSSIYYKIGLYNRAIEERRKEYNESGVYNDTIKIASYYNDMGIFFNMLKNSDSAEVYFLKATDLLNEMQYPKSKESYMIFFKSLILGNLGATHFNRGNYKEAVYLMKNDIYYSLKSNHYESAFNSCLMVIESYLNMKNNSLAKRYLDSATFLLNKEIKDVPSRLKYLLTSAKYHNAVKDYYRANLDYQEHLDLNNKAVALENEQMVKNEDVSISIEKREIENAERENTLKQLQLEEARQSSSQAYLLMGIIVLSVVIIFLVANNRSTKKREAQLSRKNQQISSQKYQIEQSLKEKDVLIKEIHHRVKNNLQIINSMLSLQIGKVEDERTETILRDAKQRISSIALTHQMLYQKENLTNINLGEYLEKLVRQVEFIMPTSNIELVTEINEKDGNLTIDNAVPLGLLVNELLTNAYKHAFPEGIQGIIKVTLTEGDDYFILTVSDNGIGLPEDFEATERKTLGIELVYILAEQLDSSITIDKTTGSSFSLKIKKYTS